MTKFIGVVVYEILPDGCLNGVYANNGVDAKNKIFNEIARKKKKTENDDGIPGCYACSYIDIGNSVHICDLEISNNNGQYTFIWKENETLKWEGIGWRTRDNQITVSYKNL